MKDLKTYILIVLMFLIVQESLSPQTLGDLGYSEYGAFPATDWELANPNRTTSHQLFGAKTTGEPGEYQYYEEVQSEDASPKILLAQGEYIMISIPGYDQCGKFDVYEDKKVEGLEKECIMTPKENVFWICDFTPGEDHSIHVFDKMGTKLLTTSFNSLPSEPPDITYNFIESGAGWIMVKVKVSDESAPNLVGVEVLYKRQDDEFWWRSYMESVSYKDDSPRVVPVHYCPEFLEDRTFCLLLSDGTWIKDENETEVEYQFKMSAFRIGPYGRIFGPATDETYTYRYCDWLQLNCNPPMGSSDEYEIYEDEFDTSIEKETSVKKIKKPPLPSGDDSELPEEKGEKHGTTPSNVTVTTLPPFLLSTTWAPEMWIENVTKPHPDILVDSNDLWVLYLALLIILISILLPLAFCLGTRAGYHEAEGYWTELSSTGGNVNISLGYVGTEWTRPVPESNA